MTEYQTIENATAEDVRPGDRVTFIHTHHPHPGWSEITATAYEYKGNVAVMGVFVIVGALNIIKVERPMPDLPTKPGAVVRSGLDADFVRVGPNSWRGVGSGCPFDDDDIRVALANGGRVLFEGEAL